MNGKIYSGQMYASNTPALAASINKFVAEVDKVGEYDGVAMAKVFLGVRDTPPRAPGQTIGERMLNKLYVRTAVKVPR